VVQDKHILPNRFLPTTTPSRFSFIVSLTHCCIPCYYCCIWSHVWYDNWNSFDSICYEKNIQQLRQQQDEVTETKALLVL